MDRAQMDWLIGTAPPDDVATLDPATAPPFASLTYGSLAPRLAALDAPWLAVGARFEGAPVGLVLGRVDPAGSAWMASLYVRPDRRGRGVGSRLMAGLADAARRRGARELSVRISDAHPSRPTLAAIVARLGSPPFRCAEVRVAGFAATMAQGLASWPSMQRGPLRQSKLSYDPWGPFNGADRDWVASLRDQGSRVPDDDVLAGKRIEPRVSVAIRHEGALVGWLMGHPFSDLRSVDAETPAIRYAGAHIAPDLGGDGALVAAFCRAFERQSGLFGPRSVASYHTSTPKLVAMTRRRFAALVFKVEEVHEATLAL